MAGVTPEGFEAKQLSEVLADAEADLALIVDPVSGDTLQPDLGSEDPAMQIVKVPLDGIAFAWQMLQTVFEQFDPTKAQGASLSALVQLNGLERQPATASSVTLTLGGTPGVVISVGQLVSDADNTTQWQTQTATVIGGGGTVTVLARCVAVGPVAASAGTLTNIVTPVAGWATVTNAAPATLGRAEETDTELRQRRAQSTMAPAASPIESIYANVSNVPGVTYARAYQNNTLAVDGRGIPAKSVAVVVVGGDDTEIAKELLARTGVSAGWFGTTTVNLFDAQDEAYAVRFSRPAPKPIYVHVTIQITNPSVFPVDGVQQIKDAIVAYAAGGAPALGVDDGFGEFGYPPGATIIASRLYTPINFVPGHRVVTLWVDENDPPLATYDVPVLWNQYGQFLAANIDVTVAP